MEARQTRESNADRLRALMARHGLLRDEVALLARVSPLTVKSWLRDPDAPAWRPMPDSLIELLWFKLEGRSCFQDAAALRSR